MKMIEKDEKKRINKDSNILNINELINIDSIFI